MAHKNAKDIKGIKFSMLTALETTEKRSWGNVVWKCQCDCGNIVFVATNSLKMGNTKSCGCLNIASIKSRAWKVSEYRKLGLGKAAFNQLYNRYRQGALQRGLNFNLSSEEFKLLIDSNCFYCECSPSREMKIPASTGSYIYNGIDRVDSSRGYEVNNCVSCCSKCNAIKHNFSIKNMIKALNFLGYKVSV